MEVLTTIRDRWRLSGETRMTKWKDTRRAIILGLLSLSVTLGSLTAWVAQTRHDATSKAEEQCIVRVGTRDDLRGVFIGIYDTLDPSHQNDRVNALRDQLNNDYPPLSLEDC